ncbi:putative membrane protein [Mycobacterium sp. BK558]|nr:putative membrane protein [Mycobacterium sp. BK558]
MTRQPLDANTRLAAERTRLAYERTLMAWIRTATGLIAFGFTIYQIFRYLAASEGLREPLVSPQVVGVVMIVVGLVSLILAWVQHRRAMATLRADFGPMPGSLAGILAALIAGLGVVALLGVTARL